jgi:hypothetical protein
VGDETGEHPPVGTQPAEQRDSNTIEHCARLAATETAPRGRGPGGKATEIPHTSLRRRCER